MQGKLFQRCKHPLYCSVLSLGGNVNTRRMSKPDMGSIFQIKNHWNILVIGNYYVNYQNFQNLILLTSSDTRRTLMHLFMLTNSAQRELISICTQRKFKFLAKTPFLCSPFFEIKCQNSLQISNCSDLIMHRFNFLEFLMIAWQICYFVLC